LNTELDVPDPKPDEVLEGEYLPRACGVGSEPEQVWGHHYGLDEMEEALGQLLVELTSLRWPAA
jgi:hypothetical protein